MLLDGCEQERIHEEIQFGLIWKVRDIQDEMITNFCRIVGLLNEMENQNGPEVATVMARKFDSDAVDRFSILCDVHAHRGGWDASELAEAVDLVLAPLWASVAGEIVFIGWFEPVEWVSLDSEASGVIAADQAKLVHDE